MNDEVLSITCERLWLGNEWRYNCRVNIVDGFVNEIQDNSESYCDVHMILPGFIDTHIHGGLGFSALRPTFDGIISWLKALAENGVCGVVLTTFGSISEVRETLHIAKKVIELQKSGVVEGALLFGVHLEGPFISPLRPGSMEPETILEPSCDKLAEIIEGFEDIIKEVTLAPELNGSEKLITLLCEKKIRVLAGHTDCSAQEAKKAFDIGVSGICHTFNACRPIHHREPGIITSALLNDDVKCEVICDLVHVDIDVIRLLYKCKGSNGIIAVSDAVSMTGLSDGVYDDGTMVIVKNGECRTLDTGDLYGGSSLVSESFVRLLKCGFAINEIIPMFTDTPLKWINMDDFGVNRGQKAFFTVWDADMRPQFSVINNRKYTCITTKQI